jgi:RHS repeat-associated protein
MTSATNENGSVTFSHDNRSRVSSTTDVFGQTIGYSYDANGNRTATTLNGSAYASYAYDAVNRLTNLADSANQNFPNGYDAGNRLVSRSAPNGVTSSYAYDGLDRLTALTHALGAATLISNQYQYNNANNITNWTAASGNHDYGYDPVNRLTSATNSAQPNENYSYDVVGNRTASHLSASYNYQPFNKLTSSATASYTYDNNGNSLSKIDSSGTTTFTWNEENQLKQVTLANALTVTYKYDALGRRIQRSTSNGAVQKFVYDSQDVIQDLDDSGQVITSYLNGPGIDNKIRQTDANGNLYYVADHLGSTIALTNDSGEMVEGIGYDSFGNSTGSSLTRYTYTGREFDPDTGLYYYRARFYDAQVGRFISEDPIALNGGLNLYTYVKNDPLRFVDPSGLTRCNRLLGTLGGAMLGGGIGALAGEAATTVVGAVAGFSVAGPAGALFGAGAGAGTGVPLSVVTGGAGALIGGVAGYRLCASDDAMPQPRAIPTCDTPPRVIPFPTPQPRSTPLFPPWPSKPGELCPLQDQTGRICTYQCKDGFRFTTMLADKNQKCPPLAGR